MVALLALIGIAWISLFVYGAIQWFGTTWLDAHPVKANSDWTNQPPSYSSVCILVAARNEANNIERTLSSLFRLDYPDFRIILIDDQSSDGTGEIARSLAAKDAVAHLDCRSGVALFSQFLLRPRL